MLILVIVKPTSAAIALDTANQIVLDSPYTKPNIIGNNINPASTRSILPSMEKTIFLFIGNYSAISARSLMP